MFEDGQLRIVIPRGLRGLIISNFHAANQGSTTIAARAHQSVYRLGMNHDIQQHASGCLDCRGIAPSPHQNFDNDRLSKISLPTGCC